MKTLAKNGKSSWENFDHPQFDSPNSPYIRTQESNSFQNENVRVAGKKKLHQNHPHKKADPHKSITIGNEHESKGKIRRERASCKNRSY